MRPVRRSYNDVSDFRAPYDRGYYQDNSLFGLGALAWQPSLTDAAPPAMRAYLATGRPMGTLRRDLGSAANQVPRLVYGALGVVALVLAYRAYKRTRSGGAAA